MLPYLFSLNLLLVIKFVHFVEKFGQIDLQGHLALLLILLVALDPDEIVVLKLVHATEEFWVVHPWNLDLAAHLIDGIEYLRV